jgi:hypothetical protein
LFAVTACSPRSALTDLPAEAASQTQVSHVAALRGWMSPGIKNTDRLLYVTANISGTLHVVNVYWVHDHARRVSRVGQITDGVDKPEGLAVDTQRELYVANLDSNTVTVYGRGKTKPLRTLNVPYPPLDVAVGSDGSVYVGDEDGGVDVFPPGGTSSTQRLTNSSLTRVAGVAVSASNDVYAAGESGYSSYQPAVVEFAKAMGSGKNLNLKGLSGRLAGVIVTDKDAIVTDFDTGQILTYQLGKTTASSTMNVGYSPVRPALSNAEHKIYVPSTYSGNTGAYDYPSGTHVNTIQNGDTGAAFSP